MQTMEFRGRQVLGLIGRQNSDWKRRQFGDWIGRQIGDDAYLGDKLLSPWQTVDWREGMVWDWRGRQFENLTIWRNRWKDQGILLIG